MLIILELQELIGQLRVNLQDGVDIFTTFGVDVSSWGYYKLMSMEGNIFTELMVL